MSDPVVIECPEGLWTKVAINITKGNINKVSNSPGSYLYTYRDTGESAPTLQAEGVPIFRNNSIIHKLWERTDEIDIYIWPVGAMGSIRIDSTGDTYGPELVNSATADYADINENNYTEFVDGKYRIVSSGTGLFLSWEGVLTIGNVYEMTIKSLSGQGNIKLNGPSVLLYSSVFRFTATVEVLKFNRHSACDVFFIPSVREVL